MACIRLRGVTRLFLCAMEGAPYRTFTEDRVMMLTMIATRRSPETHELRAGRRTVGWIRPGAVTFDGFGSRSAVEEAALAAVPVLEAWYAGRKQSIHHQAPARWADTVSREDLLWAGDVVVGRLIAPGRSKGARASHQLELLLPHTTWLALHLQLAQRVHTRLLELERSAGDVGESHKATPASDGPAVGGFGGRAAGAAVLAGQGA